MSPMVFVCAKFALPDHIPSEITRSKSKMFLSHHLARLNATVFNCCEIIIQYCFSHHFHSYLHTEPYQSLQMLKGKRVKGSCSFLLSQIFALKIFFQFCTREEGNRHIRTILLLFLQKSSCLGQWAILVPKMKSPYNYGSAVRTFLNFAKWKGLKGRSKIYYLK